jgi:hypothetical protein
MRLVVQKVTVLTPTKGGFKVILAERGVKVIPAERGVKVIPVSDFDSIAENIVYFCFKNCINKNVKGKVRPRTGHEGPEGE